MNKVYAVCLAGMLVATAATASEGGSHWGYTGHTGPSQWGDLNPAYGLCATGKNQSPIDVSGSVEAKLAPIEFEYKGNGKEIINNGHTIQVNFSAGNRIRVDGAVFELKQFHFHAPSENHIQGKSFPLEAHFVHADKDGNLAVVAVMFELGESNAALAKAWAQMPIHAGDVHALKAQLSANELLPKGRDYYRFNGSLTTPPCSEGVRWLVMKDSIKLSQGQLQTFTEVVHGPNNRPIQARNARMVMQ